MTDCITKFCALFFFVRIYLLKRINNSSSYTKEHMTVTMVGHLILMRIDFYDFISQFFSLVLVSTENWYIKHSRQCLSTFANTSMLVKNTPLRVVFSIHFSVFRDTVNFTVSRVRHINHTNTGTLSCEILRISWEKIRGWDSEKNIILRVKICQ